MKKSAALAIGAITAGIAVAALASPAMAAEGPTVQPTKASVGAWVKEASVSAMTTRTTSYEPGWTKCTIAASQASDCLTHAPGNPDTQTVTNADASRKWFRDLPSTTWKTNKYAAGVNPVSDVDRFYAYDPYQPWTAAKDLGVTWEMKAKNGKVVINSTVKKLGDDQSPATTVVIDQGGSGFSIAGKGTDGSVNMKTVARFAPDSTVVATPPK